jgi:hypothetical protein
MLPQFWLLNLPMPLVRQGTMQGGMRVGIISPDVALSPGNANLPIGGLRIANREIGVPGIQPLRFLPRLQLSLAFTADTNH